MVERDLTIKAQGEGFPQTKEQVAELNAEVAKGAQSQAAVAAGSQEAAAGLQSEGAAADVAAAGLNAEGAAAAKAATETAAVNVETAAAGPAALKGAEGLAALRTELAATSAKAAEMAAGMAPAAAGTASVGASAASSALPLTYMAIALAILPELLKKIDEGSTALSNSLISLIQGFDDEAISTKKANESNEQYQARLERIKDQSADLIRAKLAMGAGLIQETANTKLTTAELAAYQAKLHGVIEDSPRLTAAFTEFGLKVPESFEHVRASAEGFFNLYQAKIKSDGIGAANLWASESKSRLDEIISYYIAIGAKVPPELAKVAAAIGLIPKAEQEAAKERGLKQKFDEEITSANGLIATLKNSAAEFGNESTAVLGLRKEIEQQITALERLKTNTAADEAARKTAIETLKVLLAIHEGAVGKIGEHATAIEKLKEHIADLSHKLDENSKAFQANLEKIEAHRKTEIAASDQVLAKVIANTATELTTLNKSLADRTISQTEYNTNVNRLFAEQAIAKQQAYDRERQIDLDAQKAKDDLVKEDTVAKTKLEQNLKDLGISQGEAKRVADSLTESNKGVVDALQAQQELAVTNKIAIDAHSQSQRDLARDVKAAADAIGGDGGANAALGTHRQHHTALNSPDTGVPATTKHISELGTQFGVTAGEIPALNSEIRDLIGNMRELISVSHEAASAVASVTDGGGGGASAEATGLG